MSAPPGYSEHHTGYAVDIGDAEHPDTYLQQGAANSWLVLQINLHQGALSGAYLYIYTELTEFSSVKEFSKEIYLLHAHMYSEGLMICICKSIQILTILSVFVIEFERGAAYNWLKHNAARYVMALWE